MVASPCGDMVMGLLSPKAGLRWAQHGAGRCGLPCRDLAPTSHRYCERQPMNWVRASSPVSCVHSPVPCCAPARGLPSFEPLEMFLSRSTGWEPPQSNSSRCHPRQHTLAFSRAVCQLLALPSCLAGGDGTHRARGGGRPPAAAGRLGLPAAAAEGM